MTRLVRIVSVTGAGVVFRNAYGRHGETERRGVARFIACAELDVKATARAASPKATWARAQRAPRAARPVARVRVTPRQRVAAEQARARGAA